MKTITLTDEQLRALIYSLEYLTSVLGKDSPTIEDALANLRVAAEVKDSINTFGVNPTIE